MKLLLSIAVLCVGLQAQAHKLAPLTKATNPLMQAVVDASEKAAEILEKRYEHIGGGTVENAYRVTEIKPALKAGETMNDAMERVLKSALHRDYPITGDDGGYSFSPAGSIDEKNLEEVSGGFLRRDLFTEYNADASFDQLIASLQAAAQDPSLVIIAGSGAGNNTIAYIFAVLDVKNKELVYLMDSNFGSDD